MHCPAADGRTKLPHVCVQQLLEVSTEHGPLGGIQFGVDVGAGEGPGGPGGPGGGGGEPPALVDAGVVVGPPPGLPIIFLLPFFPSFTLILFFPFFAPFPLLFIITTFFELDDDLVFGTTAFLGEMIVLLFVDIDGFDFDLGVDGLFGTVWPPELGGGGGGSELPPELTPGLGGEPGIIFGTGLGLVFARGALPTTSLLLFIEDNAVAGLVASKSIFLLSGFLTSSVFITTIPCIAGKNRRNR